MTNLPKELQEIRANVETLMKKYKEIKAMPMPASPDESPEDNQNDDEVDQLADRISQLEDCMYQMMGYAHQRMSNAEDNFYNYKSDHSQGHIPQIQGAEKMQTALKVLGLDGDYQVQKPTIYAKDKYGFNMM